MANNDDNIFRQLFGAGGGRGDDRDRGGRYMLGPGGMPMVLVDGGGGGGRSHQPQVIRHADEPPVRVQLAMQFLQMAKSMTVTRPVLVPTGEGTAELKQLPPAGLEADEVAAQAAAADLMMKYFSGTLKPNIWEQTDLRPAPLLEMPCGCMDRDGKPAPNCPVCSGSGKMRLLLDPAIIQQQTIPSAVVVNKVGHPEVEQSEMDGNDTPPKQRRSPR